MEPVVIAKNILGCPVEYWVMSDVKLICLQRIVHASSLPARPPIIGDTGDV